MAARRQRAPYQVISLESAETCWSQPVVDAKGNPVGWSGTAISLLVATPFHVYAVCG